MSVLKDSMQREQDLLRALALEFFEQARLFACAVRASARSRTRNLQLFAQSSHRLTEWWRLQILTAIQGAYAFVGTWPWLPDKFAILTAIVESAESQQVSGD